MYLGRFESPRRAASDSQDSHALVFQAALVLVKGFSLDRSTAYALLAEFCQRSDSPWLEHELEHKLRHASSSQQMTAGYLLTDGESADNDEPPAPPSTPPPRVEKPTFDLEKLTRFSGDFARTVDLLWLANRSAVDPSLVKPAKYLASLYGHGEKVVVFDNDKTQGVGLWPGVEIPTTGARGVWYLCQPTDGEFHPNPRGKKGTMSRRSEESVTAWRYLVIESDEAPLRLWMGALAQLPLRIAAIYTSGGRSVHALVRVDAVTKADWDTKKHAMKTGLIILGACPGSLSAVRLTRLPGCFREGKDVEVIENGKKRLVYKRFPTPALQKLLYLNPAAPLRALADMLPTRDTEAEWLKLAAGGVADSDPTGGAFIRRGLEYYANVSPRLRAALASFGAEDGNS